MKVTLKNVMLSTQDLLLSGYTVDDDKHRQSFQIYQNSVNFFSLSEDLMFRFQPYTL